MGLQKWVVLSGLFVLSLPVLAQTEIGGASLTGTVTDPSGAVVAGAAVTAKNAATGLSRTTHTTDAGLYLVRLPVGSYTMTIEAQGFKKAEIKEIPLTVGVALPLDVPLQVGATAESVDVTAETLAR